MLHAASLPNTTLYALCSQQRLNMLHPLLFTCYMLQAHQHARPCVATSPPDSQSLLVRWIPCMLSGILAHLLKLTAATMAYPYSAHV